VFIVRLICEFVRLTYTLAHQLLDRYRRRQS